MQPVISQEANNKVMTVITGKLASLSLNSLKDKDRQKKKLANSGN